MRKINSLVFAYKRPKFRLKWPIRKIQSPIRVPLPSLPLQPGLFQLDYMQRVLPAKGRLLAGSIEAERTALLLFISGGSDYGSAEDYLQ